MVKTLLKKQLSEIFRAYFVDVKKNKARTKVSTILYFVLFAFLMIVVMSAFFGSFAFGLSSIISVGFGWLYYAIFIFLSALFGVFGSVFSTYSGLYLAKDNDLLLSMPVPVRAIMVSRLLGVYLMGLLYSLVALLPAIAIYLITVPLSTFNIIGAVFLPITVSLFVLALSCIFGYLVAKLSLKLKNKSFITVIIVLFFLALYYFVYFKATAFVSDFIANVEVYAKNIKEKAFLVYTVGKSAEGDIYPLVIVFLAVTLMLLATLYVISRSFLKIATSTATAEKVKYKQKREKSKSVLGAVLFKEAKRFTSSSNYMLNCGLGILFLFLAGVFALLKSSDLNILLNTQFSGFKDIAYIAVCAVICMIVSMNDISTPSVSLEGKTLWQIRSLPVPTKTVLKSKYLFQIICNIVPALFCAVCIVVALKPDILTAVLILIFTAEYVCFHAIFSIFCGLHKPNLNWANEIVPIKQGIGVLFAIFGGWGYAILLGGSYLLFGMFISTQLYLLIFVLITALIGLLIYRWINTKGITIFENL